MSSPKHNSDWDRLMQQAKAYAHCNCPDAPSYHSNCQSKLMPILDRLEAAHYSEPAAAPAAPAPVNGNWDAPEGPPQPAKAARISPLEHLQRSAKLNSVEAELERVKQLNSELLAALKRCWSASTISVVHKVASAAIDKSELRTVSADDYKSELIKRDIGRGVFDPPIAAVEKGAQS